MTSVQRLSIVTLVKNGKGCVAESGASVQSKKEFVRTKGSLGVAEGIDKTFRSTLGEYSEEND